jgi:cysteine desulfurase family protein
MIYLDNAATTKYKPESVFEAFNYYARNVAVSPGRGSYSLGIEASRMLYKTRKVVGNFFGLGKPTNVVFTKNSTEAINLFFRGFLNKGDHVVITCYEHNAVLRPLHEMKEAGLIEYTVINIEDINKSPELIYTKYFKENTRVFATTLASNLTGRVVFNKELLRYLSNKGITIFLDSSQGAGKIKISMEEDKIDYLAFTGHKDLMALPGVGGLCCSEEDKVRPLIQGGTGILGDSYVNPDVFPEGLEAGTLNMPAIWSLNAALVYLNNNWNQVNAKEKDLMKRLLDGLRVVRNIKIYDEEEERVSTVGININGISSDKLVQLLDQKGICVRGGIHCAILAHEALGTVKSGIVRLSVNSFNEKEEIDEVISVLKEVGDYKCI